MATKKPMSDRRAKIGEVIRKALAMLMLREIDDVHMKHVLLSRVVVSPDQSHAKVYFTTRTEDEVPLALKHLKKASRYLRYQLAQNIQLRKAPELHFFHDEAQIEGERIVNLLQSLNPQSDTEL